MASPGTSLLLPAVVVNPTKFDDLSTARRKIEDACRRRGWQRPLWLETTAEDPGVGQGRTALEAGADVVMACGGDGTVRAVAQALAGSDVPFGLLPAGTGNLLARNLDMELNDLDAAVAVALTGSERRVDVGWVRVDGRDEERAFMVMGGMGFDAQVMETTEENLKSRVGPLAYVVAGARHLVGRHTRIRITLPSGIVRTRRVRSVVLGNCGKLLGGISLIPRARLDDGLLDLVAVAPGDAWGWGAVLLQVVTRARLGHRRVEYWKAISFTLTASSPQPAQLDGDPIGECTTLEARVDPGALRVRVRYRGARP